MIKDRHLRKVVAESKRREITTGMIEQATQEKDLDYNRCFFKDCSFSDSQGVGVQVAAQQSQISVQMRQMQLVQQGNRAYVSGLWAGQGLGLVGGSYKTRCILCGK